MILTSTTEAKPFTPAWHCGADGEPNPSAPSFMLRAGSVIERGQMEAELAGPCRAGRVYDFELRGAMRAGVSELLADDPELDRVVTIIDAEQADGELALSEDDGRLFAEIRKVLSEHYQPYADFVARLERRRELRPIVALRRFCVGWENVLSDAGHPVTFARGRDGMVSDAALGAVQPLEVVAAGNQAYQLQFGAGQEGNSLPLSPSDDSQKASTSGSTSTAAGKSPAKRGRKTPE